MVERRRCAKGIEEAVDDIRGAIPPLLEGELLRVTTGADPAQAISDRRIRLLPGDALPLALAALADALQGIQQPVRIVEHRRSRDTLGTDRALVIGILRVPGDREQAPIFYRRDHAARCRAALAHRRNALHGSHRFPSPYHAIDRTTGEEVQQS